MVRLVFGCDAAQDRHGVLNGRLPHVHLLETPLEGRILLNLLAVLIQRCGTDQPQFPTRQHGLEHIARVHGALGAAASPHDGVELIDKRHDFPGRILDFLQNGLEPLLEFAAVLRAGHHRGHVQLHELLATQGFGDVTIHHPLREPLNNRRLSHTRFADQHRVVLRAARQHLNHTPDLRITPDHRIHLALAGKRGEIRTVLLKGLERPLRIRRIHLRAATHRGQHGRELVARHASRAQDFSSLTLRLRDGHEQMLSRNIGIAQRGGLFAGIRNHERERARSLRLAHRRSRCPGQRRERSLCAARNSCSINSHRIQ